MRPRLTRITCFHRCSGLCRNFPRWSKSCLKVISVDLQAVSAGPRWATYFIIYKLLAGTYLYKYLLNTSSHNGDYIVPFSASKQTHCALVICGSEWVTVALHSVFWISTEVVYLHSYSAVWLWHCWCHVKLLPSWHMFFVHHTAVHQFTVSLYLKPHTYVTCACVF